MDDSVRAAMERWPDVPAVYGWLSLDCHGRWCLRDEPITHPGLVAFINRNYDHDEAGRWYFQNGPQRGYVRLEYTPWVLHTDESDVLRTHTGRRIRVLEGAWVDRSGNLLLETDAGIGLVDPDALPRVSGWLIDDADRPVEAETIEALTDPTASDGPRVDLCYGGSRAPLQPIDRDRVPERFGFVPDPAPMTGGAG